MPATDMYAQVENAEISRSADQVFTELQGEVVILNVKSGKYYNLNEMGAFIWKLLDAPRTVRSIVDVVLAEYNVERERCEKDVTALLYGLHQAGLVQVAPSSVSR